MRARCLIIVILLSCCGFAGFCQKNLTYSDHIKIADSLYKHNDFLKAGKSYSNAFRSNSWLGTVEDRYKAAQAWSKGGNADSAFYQLFRIVKAAKFGGVDKLKRDESLNSLHKDKRWSSLIESANINVKSIDTALKVYLEAIYTEDQKYRVQLDSIQKINGHGSKEEDRLWQIIGNKDVENQTEITKFLDTHGWLGKDKVGEIGNRTLFLVIQHAELGVQEKYLPMLKEAVAKGNAEPGHLAYLQDRIAVRNGRKQLYGTQVSDENGRQEVHPIEDEVNVDARRRKMGLQPLSEYLKHFGIDYKKPASK